MPVKSCKEGGKPGWKWGDAGKCYVFPAGDEKASGKAKQKAYLQGVAATGGSLSEAISKEIEEWIIRRMINQTLKRNH